LLNFYDHAQNIEFQRKALSLCMTYFPKANLEDFTKLLDEGITREHFSEKRANIFDILLKLKNNKDELREEHITAFCDKDTITELMETVGCCISNYIIFYTDRLKEHLWRKVFGVQIANHAEKILKSAPIEDTKEGLIKLGDLITKSLESKKTIDFRSSDQIAEKLLLEIEQRIIKNKDKNTVGLQSGFNIFDKKLNGFCNSRMYILAARTSIGKTTLALNFSHNIINQKKKVLFFTCEMTDMEITEKLLSLYAGIDYNKIFSGNLNKEEQDKIYKDINYISVSGASIYHKFARSISRIETIANDLKNKNSLDFMVVDYIGQIVNPELRTKLEVMTDVSARLKGLALDLNIPVLVLAQLNRETVKDDKPPQLHHIKDCGAIEQDADVVMFLNRTVNGYAYDYSLDIAKNRHGELFDFRIGANLEKNRFFDFN
jgi:replicative DNA helicase